MSKKTLGSKLAQGVRQARQPTAEAAKKIAPPPARKTTVPSPAPSRDNTWNDLHPERIWPD